MRDSNVLQTLLRGPLKHKGMRVSEHSNEPHYVWVFQEAKLVQLVSHVAIATNYLRGNVMETRVRLIKHFDCHFQLPLRLCVCVCGRVCGMWVVGGYWIVKIKIMNP